MPLSQRSKITVIARHQCTMLQLLLAFRGRRYTHTLKTKMTFFAAY